VDLVRDPASWNSIALETCRSPSISAVAVVVASECCDRAAFMVLDVEPPKTEVSSENRDSLGPFSVEGLFLSYEGLVGSSDGRGFSGVRDDVEGREGGEGGAAP